MTNKLLIQVPFEGFYNTWHDQMLDDEVNCLFQTDDTGCHSAVPNEWYFAVNFKSAFIGYAKVYLDEFCRVYEDKTGVALNLEWESMSSPKEYNFDTDRIFAYIDALVVVKLHEITMEDNFEQLEKTIKANCTSYSGFHSWYSNDLGEWLKKPVLFWDHNELKILLEAVLEMKSGDFDEDDDFKAYNLMERVRGNGVISNLIYEIAPQEFLEFADYQREQGQECSFAEWKENRAEIEATAEDNKRQINMKFTNKEGEENVQA